MNRTQKLMSAVAGVLISAPTIAFAADPVAPSQTPSGVISYPASNAAGNVSAQVTQIQNATDASVALEAYNKGNQIDPANTQLAEAFVQKMVDLGLPERAVDAADDAVGKDPAYGLGWAVIADRLAKHGQMPGAMANITSAVNRSPGDPFVVKTAAGLFAWYDLQTDHSDIPQAVQQAVAARRDQLASNAQYVDTYNKAKAYFVQQQQQQQQPQTNAAPAVQQPAAPTTPTPQASTPAPGTIDNNAYQVRDVTPPPGTISSGPVVSPPPPSNAGSYTFTYDTYTTTPVIVPSLPPAPVTSYYSYETYAPVYTSPYYYTPGYYYGPGYYDPYYSSNSIIILGGSGYRHRHYDFDRHHYDYHRNDWGRFDHNRYDTHRYDRGRSYFQGNSSSFRHDNTITFSYTDRVSRGHTDTSHHHR